MTTLEEQEAAKLWNFIKTADKDKNKAVNMEEFQNFCNKLSDEEYIALIATISAMQPDSNITEKSLLKTMQTTITRTEIAIQTNPPMRASLSDEELIKFDKDGDQSVTKGEAMEAVRGALKGLKLKTLDDFTTPTKPQATQNTKENKTILT